MIRWILLLATLCGLFPACNTNDGGTEIPNELVGKEFIAGQGPAADAEIKLIPVGYLPGASGSDSGQGVFLSGKTDAKGRFAFTDVPPGRYNLIASKDGLQSFRDSLAITGRGRELAADTLKAPGSMAGMVQLEPQHDPRSATVQVLGTTVFVNVAQDGSFILGPLGAGEYRLRLVTNEAGYVPLYREFTVQAGIQDTLPEPLRPFFTGTPVVKGLSVVPGPQGTLVLRWRKPEYPGAQGYLIYRDTAGALLPAVSQYRRVDDTAFIDTIYSGTPGPGQHPYLDSAFHSYDYRVRLLDRDGKPGPSYGFVGARAVPPSLKFNSGLWRKSEGSVPGSYVAAAAAFHDRLWLAATDAGGTLKLWSTVDAIDWNLEATDPFPGTWPSQLFVFQDKFWAFGSRPKEQGTIGEGNPINVLWSSADGSRWAKVNDSAGITGRQDGGVVVHADRLWAIDGNTTYLHKAGDIWSSADGAAWRLEKPELPFTTSQGSTASFGGRIWVVGGGSFFRMDYNFKLFSSADGKAWNATEAAPGMLPRSGNALIAHGGRLWCIGGVEFTATANEPTYYNDVWSSPDGKTWTLVDAHAPFAARSLFRSVSFQGRLWVLGGINSTLKPEGYSDIWYLQDP